MFDLEEKSILNDCRKVFKNHQTNKVIDVDEKLGKKLECFIIPLEKLLQETGPVIPPYRQSRFSIIYIKKGKGKKIVGALATVIKNQMLFTIPSRVVSSSVYTDKNLKGYYLAFNLDCFLQMPFHFEHLLKLNFFNQALHPYYFADTKQAKVLEGIFEAILSETYYYKKNRDYLIACKLIELAIECDRLQKVKESTVTNHPLVVQFINLIPEHYKKSHSVNFYAKKLLVHPNSLNAVAKLYLRQTAKATINSKVLSEAQYLLKQTNLSVKEIAYDLGFKSASYFFRFFRKYTGNSPVEYRYRQRHLK